LKKWPASVAAAIRPRSRRRWLHHGFKERVAGIIPLRRNMQADCVARLNGRFKRSQSSNPFVLNPWFGSRSVTAAKRAPVVPRQENFVIGGVML